jgi:hypothetical protein
MVCVVIILAKAAQMFLTGFPRVHRQGKGKEGALALHEFGLDGSGYSQVRIVFHRPKVAIFRKTTGI